MANSAVGKINLEDLKSLLYTALIMGAATVVTYTSTHLSGLHLTGDQEMAVSFVLSLVGKLLQKVLQGK